MNSPEISDDAYLQIHNILQHVFIPKELVIKL